jgi:hypothetical protein
MTGSNVVPLAIVALLLVILGTAAVLRSRSDGR